jgi:primosomal protein N'
MTAPLKNMEKVIITWSEAATRNDSRLVSELKAHHITTVAQFHAKRKRIRAILATQYPRRDSRVNSLMRYMQLIFQRSNGEISHHAFVG